MEKENAWDIKTEPKGTLVRPPKHIKYEPLKARLDSFIGWPRKYVPKTPEELATAGFFYIGSADRVTCFQCGITLRDWESEHDPVVEHRKYSEHCQFINRTDLNHLGVEERVMKPQAVTSPVSDTALTSLESNVEWHGQESGNINSGEQENIAVSNQQSEVQNSETNISNGHLVCATRRLSLSDFKDSSFVKHGADSSEAMENVKLNGLEEEAQSKPKHHNENAAATNPAYEENKKLRSQMTCRLCKNSGVNTVFLPCGHLVTCSDCSSSVTSCVVCSKTIVGTVKTYMA